MRVSLAHIAVVVFTLLLFTLPASAEDLTLNDCIELALEKRASIIQARNALNLAAANQRYALGAFLPQFNASYQYTKGKETDIEPVDPVDPISEQDIGPNKSLNLRGSWTVLNIGNIFGYTSSVSNKEAARLDVIASEQDLIYSVKLSYYAYLANVENVDVQKDAVARSDEQLKLIQSRYELGSASKSDVLKQQVQYGNDQLALLRAENAVVTSKASLLYTIGLDPNEDVQLATDYDVREYTGSMSDAITFGMQHQPTLLSFEKSISAASKNLKARYGNYLPSLSLFVNHNRFSGTQSYPVVFDYSSNTTTYGFSISLNIFDGFLREYNVTSAKVSLNNARAGYSDQKNLVSSNIKTAYFEIEQEKVSQSVANDNVAAAEEDLKITQEKYNLGAATILDLLDAQVSLKEAQVSKIQADFNLNLAIAKLENAMGKM